MWKIRIYLPPPNNSRRFGARLHLKIKQFIIIKRKKYQNVPIYKLFFSQLFIHTNTKDIEDIGSQLYRIKTTCLISFTYDS